MKKIIKSKFGIFAIVLTLFIFSSSCEKDLYEDNIKNSSKNIKVTHVSLNDLDRKISSKINEKISAIKKQNIEKNKNHNKFEYDSSLDLYIDTENGKLVDNNGELSYTFPMFRDSEDNLENIIFKNLSDGEIETYISKYNVKPEEFKHLSQEDIQNLNPTFEKIMYQDDGVIVDYNCVSIYTVETEYNSWELNEGNGNPSSSSTIEVFVATFCNYTHTFSEGGGTSGTGGTSGNDGNNGPTGNGGGTTTGGSGGVTTSPVLSPKQIKQKCLMKNQLTEDETNWLNQPANAAIKDSIYDYLENQPQDSGNLECYDIEDVEEIKDIIDIMDDGMVDGEPVLVGPNEPIDDMEEYLSCFNTSLGATITIYADQPITNSHFLFGPDKVGHAFISITQGTNIKTFGFYPISTPGSLVGSTPGIFGNDQGHDYDTSISAPVNATTLVTLINGLINVSESTNYDIHYMNCTDVAVVIGNLASINIPSCESPLPWNGQTPGTLGQVIRAMPTPTSGSKNTSGGNAPNNNCN